jgi:methionine synthase II (cobalamin-independent)
MSTPYRADQVGSFLRPAELIEARQATPPDPARVRAL